MGYQQTGAGWFAAFLESQHIPQGSRLSAWFHGESEMKGMLNKKTKTGRGKISERKIELVPGSSVHLDGYAMQGTSPELPRSTNPYSPTNFSRPLTFDKSHYSTEPYVHPAFASPCEIDAPCKPPTKVRQQKVRQKTRAHRTGPRCMRSKDPRIRCKSIGTFVSGTVLAVVLTVYLAMATSNAVPTTAFHVTFIFCIIVLTIVFAHFLIRLCMLTLRGQPHYARQTPILRHRGRHHHHQRRDLEAGLRQPSYANNQGRSFTRQTIDERIRTDKDIAPAPPAYGWWRGSIRIDPEEIRYHDPDESDLHQHTRSLVFAGSGQRPPSYTSDPLEVAVSQPEPLFHRPGEEAPNRTVRDV